MEGAETAAVFPESCLNLLEDIEKRHRAEINRMKLLSNSGSFTDIVKKRSRIRNGHFCSVCFGEDHSKGNNGVETVNCLEFEVHSRDLYPGRRLIRSISTPVAWKSGIFCTCRADNQWETVNDKSQTRILEKSKSSHVPSVSSTKGNKAEAECPKVSHGEDKVSGLSLVESDINSTSSAPPLPPAHKPIANDASSQQTEKAKLQSGERSSGRRGKTIYRASSESIGMFLTECPPHGAMCVKGRRREMEDAISVVPSFFSFPKSCSTSITSSALQHGLSGLSNALHFFAVYDGHGGSQVRERCGLIINSS
eukprot:TRINITY_DN133_c0_g1_i1.p1 TRINITY_DN133_c0_g1~~TRINITY_DN133_c0_g1_i1.p1  ORF type:complete len:309 (+),score=41.23 TRINITY_DN133_c0_g1_i1:710-1636(+)